MAGPKKLQIWSTVNDDDLQLVDKMSNFLQSEFCLKGTDQMWSPEYFKWKLSSSNPAGKGYVSLAIENGEVVGSISITKKRLLIDGKECIGAEIGDSYTASSIKRRGKPDDLSSIDSNPKSYLNKSIFGRLVSEVRLRAESDGISIIYGTPNKFSYPGYLKHLDFIEMEQYINKSYFRPTSRLLVKQYSLLKLLYPVFRIVELASIKISSLLYSFAFDPDVWFDNSIPTTDELNKLWGITKPNGGFSLIRDAQYWQHRYSEHPLANYTFFSARHDGKLVGVYVTRQFASGENKSSLSIVEWMVIDSYSFGHALAYMLDFHKYSKVDFYYLWAQESSKEAKNALKNLFLLKRMAPIILANTKLAQKVNSFTKNIRFYLGSSDAI